MSLIPDTPTPERGGSTAARQRRGHRPTPGGEPDVAPDPTTPFTDEDVTELNLNRSAEETIRGCRVCRHTRLGVLGRGGSRRRSGRRPVAAYLATVRGAFTLSTDAHCARTCRYSRRGADDISRWAFPPATPRWSPSSTTWRSVRSPLLASNTHVGLAGAGSDISERISLRTKWPNLRRNRLTSPRAATRCAALEPPRARRSPGNGNEPQPDRQLHLGRGGPDPRHLQARQVPGRHPAAHRAATARLRAGPNQAKRAGGPGQVRGQDRQPRPAAPARLRLRLLQHVTLRLREAAGRCSPNRPESAQLHRRVQPEHARGPREVRLRQHHLQARRIGAPVPGRAAVSAIRR